MHSQITFTEKFKKIPADRQVSNFPNPRSTFERSFLRAPARHTAHPRTWKAHRASEGEHTSRAPEKEPLEGDRETSRSARTAAAAACIRVAQLRAARKESPLARAAAAADALLVFLVPPRGPGKREETSRKRETREALRAGEILRR